tara:strand:+ start:9845 stop:10909 length:1065 start_codon:yes stop_codon:yes gene_type:complete
MKNINQIQILNFIVKLLHPNLDIDLSNFSMNQRFWDELVRVGSAHLLLPSIFESLKRKNLANHIPSDLFSFLEEISSVNFNRNKSIFKQITFLSNIFNDNGINHVFLKGSALLILKPYNTLRERMVGDIDILVDEAQIFKARNLLLDLDFKEMDSGLKFFRKDIFKYRHLPRLTNSNYIAAVELHSHLLKSDFNHLLNPEKIFDEKDRILDTYNIPSIHDLWIHSILNWQINDNGMKINNLNFRTVNDVFYLEPDNLNFNTNNSCKAVKHFYSLLSLHSSHYPIYFRINKLIYNYNLKSKVFYRFNLFLFKFSGLIYIILNRISLLFKSKTYRNRIKTNHKILFKKLKFYWKKG